MDWETFWANVGDFTWTLLTGKIVPIIIIIVVVLVVRWLLHFVIRRVVNRIVSGVKKTQNVDDTQALSASPLAAVRLVQRSRTLGSVLSNVVNIILFVVTVLLIVNVVDKTILGSFTLLTAAIGAGLGFGAQKLVGDVLNGLFMVMEDQLGVGDIVDLGPATGMVETVGIRVTQLRDVNGILWFVRNGEILRVGNTSQGWARVIIDVSVPSGTDTSAAEETIRTTALSLTSEVKWRALLLDKPEVWGLESITADSAILRLTVKTRSSTKDDVARELRMRLKEAFDEQEIQLPGLTSTVLTGFERAASVRGARPPHTKPLPFAPEKTRRTKAKPATEKPKETN